MAELTLSTALQQAIQLHQAGRLPEAEALYRAILTRDSRCADALHYLGVIALQLGQHDRAVESIRQAAALSPNNPAIHSNLGEAYRQLGHLDEAVAGFRRALSLQPVHPDALNNLGNALTTLGQFDDAAACFNQALALQPNSHHAHYNLGLFFKDRGQRDAAISHFHRAIALQPDFPQAHNNLGNLFRAHGQLNEAVASYQAALALKSDFAEAHANLGTLYRELGRLDDALVFCRQALALKPGLADYHNNLGNVLKDRGQLDDALAAYQQAIANQPDHPSANSNFLYTTLFHPRYDSQSIFTAHRCWSEQRAASFASTRPPHSHDRTPERRLRIGYVSPDFRDHVVGRNVLPLLNHHHHGHFEIACYADVSVPDAVTDRFRKSADVWRDVTGLSDDRFAQLVRDDQIDILVDLTLHMAGNRLLALARKPAPVQVTFAGYPGTTGLGAVDYRLTDPFLDPPGVSDAWYAENSFRLPDSFWCFDPFGEEPAVSPLPAQARGFVTFGCLNNFCKINPAVLALWARVFRAVPNSRMLLLSAAGDHRQTVLDRLSREGIASTRIEFLPLRPRHEYLKLYRDIDVGLDTFPYNGHTTSLDSYWMGVPVFSLVGSTVVGRAGWSQLSNLGLTELAAHAEDEFVHLASRLARDLPRLAALRASLRERMRHSPLMDAPRFTRAIEAAYRTMWHRWCAQPGSAAVPTP